MHTTNEKFIRFFGWYLLAKGVIDEATLDQAVQHQREANKLIGQVAVEKGYMDDEGVNRVAREQRLADEPFGAIAVRLGLLTKDQLDDLLFVQNVHSSHLGEALLALGLISETQFSVALDDFFRLEQERAELIEHALAAHPAKRIYHALIYSLEHAFPRFMRKAAKVSALAPPDASILAGARVRIRLRLNDARRYECVFVLDDDGVESIAQQFDPDRVDLDREQALHACLEFMAIVERYLAQQLTTQGRHPVETVLEGELLDDEARAVVIPEGSFAVEMATPAGSLGMRIAVKELAPDAPAQREGAPARAD